MMSERNPFKASLGVNPPFLAGREEEVDDFESALLDGPGVHERISLVTGLRGVGKTVLLNHFERVARKQAWWVISESATPGFIDRIRDKIFRIVEDQKKTGGKKISGVTLPLNLGGMQFEAEGSVRPPLTLRDVVTEFLEWQAEVDQKLGQEPIGLLITLDELHYYHKNDVIEFATTIQHLVREDRQIAVAMAGIPQAIRPLLASEDASNPVTFLRRANRIDLGSIDDVEVRNALEQPLLTSSVQWDEEALEDAVKSCGGYPFLVQLVGQESFRKRVGEKITLSSVEIGARNAKRKLGRLVHDPALKDLSDVDRTFLIAMTKDDGPSRMADIAKRMNADPQYVGKYRQRLLAAEMIMSVGHGLVDFALPYLRDYLRQLPHAEVMDL